MPKPLLYKLTPWFLSALGVLVGCDAAVPDNTFVPMPRQVTYHEDVAPLLEDACSDCHGPADAISLADYEAAAAVSDAIADVVLGKVDHVPTGLTDDEAEVLLAWDEAGNPVGPVPIPAGGDKG